MAKLTYLIIHCTDTPKDREVSKKDIEQWHLKGRGWDRLGYSDMVHLNGALENLTPYDSDDFVDSDEMTWGCAGKNSVARHMVYVGGKGGDTRTKEQKRTIENKIKMTIREHPDIIIAGHNQFSSKACPSFDVPEFCKEIGLARRNIKDSK